MLMLKVIHVNRWDEFKRLTVALRPSSISYTIQRAPLSKPPIGLRLIFAAEKAQYVFLDFAENNALRRTKIPVRINETGEAYISEEDIKNFLIAQLERTDVSIYSLEVLGY